MLDQEAGPNTRAGDMQAMSEFWDMVSTLLGGTKEVRAARTAFLPRFPDELEASYNLRAKHAKYTNIFRDIVENLAQRPFAQEVKIDDGAPEQISNFVDDVDGRGKSLHSFASEAFFSGISYGLDWILIDYPKKNDEEGQTTRAQEAEMGLRPYWVHKPASSVLAAYTAMSGGEEQLIHIRLAEPEIVRDGFEEKTVKRVRIYDREELSDGVYGAPTWRVLEERKVGSEIEWVEVGSGSLTIGVIPLVPLCLGRRFGMGWEFHPPMSDAAYLQVEHYQQESALKHVEELTAFPMLAGNGVQPPLDEHGKVVRAPVGPHSVLYAPPSEGGSGSWSFIEPGGTSLTHLLSHIAITEQQLRELGRQPLTAQSGNLTVVTTAFAAQKGNAAIQAWALLLKDALKQALDVTALWYGVEYEPDVTISTDFDLGLGDDDTFEHVRWLFETAGLIDEVEVTAEAKRRNILRPEYEFELPMMDVVEGERDGLPTAEPDSSQE